MSTLRHQHLVHLFDCSVFQDLHDHYFLQRPLDGYEPPELPIPLYQRLIHLINCRIESFYKFDVSGRSWCRNEVQLSMFE